MIKFVDELAYYTEVKGFATAFKAGTASYHANIAAYIMVEVHVLLQNKIC